MNLIFIPSHDYTPLYENDLEAFIPELWAGRALEVLSENMVASALVYRDYESTLANYGDIVNVQKPGEFSAVRKVPSDNVTVQDATASNVQVALNHHVHTSFLIRDGEESKSMLELMNLYLVPAVISQARYIDQMTLGQWPQFVSNSVGGAGLFNTTTAKSYLLSLRQKMNDNKCYVAGRNLVLNSSTETTLLSVSDLTLSSAISGNQESAALRNATLGRLLGFDTYLDQNMAIVASGNTTTSGAVNNASGYAAGISTVTVDGITGAVLTGKWFTVAGDMIPHRVTAHTETLGNTTSITFTPALGAAVVDNAVITFYSQGEVNNAAGYAAGWAKAIIIDGFTVAPKVGQIISFDSSPSVLYTVIGSPTTTSIMLDRPLVSAIADNDDVFIGPAGNYNFAFHRNALALVVRPLAAPKVGALSSVMDSNGLSMRATVTYDGNKQGHLVTLDFLCGVAVLDSNLGAVLVG